ncbi:MAG: hypothetical protein QOJ09_425 [Actinomycetota bacterium]|jgi:hypothetical protein|nr:hypothetical protein [Actinomycetota bacterium]
MTRDELISRYEAGSDEVAAALDGITDEGLDRRPGAGEWTAREIVHHLADSEATSYIRLRRLLAEDAPAIVGYDQDLWSQRLHYDRPIAPSLAVLDAVRAASAELLRAVDPSAFSRAGTHDEHGAYSVTTWLEIYADHAHDHAEQIRRVRRGAA